jgi:hypothetical protein
VYDVRRNGCSFSPVLHNQRYNRHLKRAFLLLAFNQIRWSEQARTYYDRKRASGKSHWAALRIASPGVVEI